jgi:cytochrome c oxidase subunit 2
LYNFATGSYAEFYLGAAPVSRMNHEPFAEIIFTVVPAIIVYTIAAPSFALLYSSNDWLERETELTVSITGHQWYWNYEYSLDKLYFNDEDA